MAVYWKNLENVIYPDLDIINDILDLTENIDQDGVMAGAAKSVARITNFYNLDISSLADGIITYPDDQDEEEIIYENRTNYTLTASDCCQIANQSFISNYIEDTDEWLVEALNRSDNDSTIIANIFEYLSISRYNKQDYSQAFQYMRQSINLSEDIDLREKRLNSSRLFFQTDIALMKKYFNVEQYSASSGSEIAKILCRDTTVKPDNNLSNLHCYHMNTNKIPILRLKHIRIEEINKQPQIIIIHNFLTEYEVKVFKQLAKPNLSRMGTIDNFSKKTIFNDYRVAEGCSVSDSNKTIARISDRISAITGFNLLYAESYNVVAYGVAGYYFEHHDFKIVENSTFPDNICPRASTWINYLSDVKAGGATYFPLLNRTVWPEKYSAVFWPNLLMSGEIDVASMHGGCPVLVGTKWIAVKWIHQPGQEFYKPCALNRSDQHQIVF